MADLYTVVIAEIERLERLYGHDNDPTHTALRATVERHRRYSAYEPEWCTTCLDGEHSLGVRFPCDELRTIAVVLGADVALELPAGGGGDG